MLGELSGGTPARRAVLTGEKPFHDSAGDKLQAPKGIENGGVEGTVAGRLGQVDRVLLGLVHAGQARTHGGRGVDFAQQAIDQVISGKALG